MKATLSIVLALLSGLFISAAVMPDDSFSSLIEKAEMYLSKHPQEKVHLHLDKPYYAIGDDIWFKAYVTETQKEAPSDISGALYVELIHGDSLVRQLKLPLALGITWGDFKLPDSLPEGNYRIRAYTQWMRNAGPEFFFDKTIKVGNSWSNQVFASTSYQYSKIADKENVTANIAFTGEDNTPLASNEVRYEVRLDNKTVSSGKARTNAKGEIDLGFVNSRQASGASGEIIAKVILPGNKMAVKHIPILATSDQVDVQFFPEGGQLVSELPSKIGIKATAPNGLGYEIEGAIQISDGPEMTRFKTSALGMGHVVISPQPGKTYTAKVRFKDGSEKSFPLPVAAPQGYVLNVNNTSTKIISSKILISKPLLNTGELRLVAMHSGKLYLSTKVSSAKQITTISIPKKGIPSGIVQLTLFSPDNRPIAERLVFVNHPEDRIISTLKTEKAVYKKREKVNLDLKTLFDGKPAQGSFSVAVTNSQSVTPDEDNESNILTSLLLTSDLVGHIEKPNRYFKDDQQGTVEALDNLMLTQGWRRYSLDKIMQEAGPAIAFQPEKTLRISGRITRDNKKPFPNAKVSILSSKQGMFVADTVANEQGYFVFDNLVFSDSTKFLIQGRTAKDKKFVEIDLDMVPGQVVTKNKNTGDVEVNVNESISSYLRSSNNFFEEQMKKGMLRRTIQLEEVRIVQARPNKASPNSWNLNGPGKADFVFAGEDLSSCVTVLDCIQGKVPGLMIRYDTEGMPYATLMRHGGKMMSVFIDGMKMTDLSMLDMILPDAVESVEILRSTHYLAAYGGQARGGAIIITTKFDGRVYNTYVPGIVTFTPKGYHSTRQFYSPKYNPVESISGKDFRSTVYWNPHFLTDTAGNARLSFFNTDEAGEYRVVLEGIEGSGKLARQVYTYKVN
jgi:hypothetical protein